MVSEIKRKKNPHQTNCVNLWDFCLRRTSFPSQVNTYLMTYICAFITISTFCFSYNFWWNSLFPLKQMGQKQTPARTLGSICHEHNAIHRFLEGQRCVSCVKLFTKESADKMNRRWTSGSCWRTWTIFPLCFSVTASLEIFFFCANYILHQQVLKVINTTSQNKTERGLGLVLS